MNFSDYDEWMKACRARGFHGPYVLLDGVKGQQFVYPDRGTAAFWNDKSQQGFIFEEPKT